MFRFIQVVIAIICAALAGNSFGATTVFEISKGQHKIFLAGTIHLLREQDFPLPPEFDAAYNQSQKIYFETDLQQVKTPEFSQRFTQAMTLPDHKTLQDVLQPDVWAQLQAYADKTQYPLSQTKMFNPAMLSILITLTESKNAGIGEGVDAFYDRQARQDQKFVGGLETADDVLAYMNELAKEDPNNLIKSTLDEVGQFTSLLETMIAAWKIGDLAALDKNMAQPMRATIPNGYRSLVVDRNKKWLPQLEAMLKTPDTEMVMVGSMHLSGKDGLLALLKKDGYNVKPLVL